MDHVDLIEIMLSETYFLIGDVKCMSVNPLSGVETGIWTHIFELGDSKAYLFSSSPKVCFPCKWIARLKIALDLSYSLYINILYSLPFSKYILYLCAGNIHRE